jgi:hypothetical protein
MRDGVGIGTARLLGSIPRKSDLNDRRLISLFVERGSWVNEAGLKVDGGRSGRSRSKIPLPGVCLREGLVTSDVNC